MSAPPIAGCPVPAPVPASAPNINSHLKNGKLTDAECKWCMDTGACLYCGELGHLVLVCPKRLTLSTRVSNADADADVNAEIADIPETKPSAHTSYIVDLIESSDSGKD